MSMQILKFKSPTNSANKKCRVYKKIDGIFSQITNNEYDLTVNDGFIYESENIIGEYEVRCIINGNECIYTRNVTQERIDSLTPTATPTPIPTATPTPIPTATPTPTPGNPGPIDTTPTATPTPIPTATPTPTPTTTPTPIYSWNIVITDFSADPCVGGDEFILYGQDPNILFNDVLYTNNGLTNQWVETSSKKVLVDNDLIYEWDGQSFIGVIGNCLSQDPTPNVPIEMRRYLDGDGETDNPNSLVFDHSFNKKLLCINETNGTTITIHTFETTENITEQMKFHTSSSGGFDTLVEDGIYSSGGKLFRTIGGRVTEIDDCTNLTVESFMAITGITSENTCNRDGETSLSIEVFTLYNPPRNGDIIYSSNPFTNSTSNLSNGYYSYNGRWFELDNNEVINNGICPDPTLTFEPSELEFLSGGGDVKTFTISSNVKWEISTTNDFITNINPTEGENDGTVTVSVTQNQPGNGPRSGWVDITSIINNQPFYGNRVRILQDEFIPILESDLYDVVLPPGGGSETITITSNETWSSSGTPFLMDWLSVVPSVGTDTVNPTNVVLSAPENNVENRSGVLTLTAAGSGDIIEINVTQDRLKYVEVWYNGQKLTNADNVLTERTITLERGSFITDSIEIRSNIEESGTEVWSVSSRPVSWLTVTFDQDGTTPNNSLTGKGTKTIYVKTLSINDGNVRSVGLNISGGDTPITNLIIRQEGI